MDVEVMGATSSSPEDPEGSLLDALPDPCGCPILLGAQTIPNLLVAPSWLLPPGSIILIYLANFGIYDAPPPASMFDVVQ